MYQSADKTNTMVQVLMEYKCGTKEGVIVQGVGNRKDVRERICKMNLKHTAGICYMPGEWGLGI